MERACGLLYMYASAVISGRNDMNLEIDIIPVSDVERSKQFYRKAGWRYDDDTSAGNDVRIVQFTPPGAGCSVTFGKCITAAAAIVNKHAEQFSPNGRGQFLPVRGPRTEPLALLTDG